MKRFVTYLYACDRGNKEKNVGFIRMKVQSENSRMEVYIRNLQRATDEGNIFVFLYEEELLGIELGRIKIRNGQSDSSFDLQTENLMESGNSLNEVVGVGIRLDSGGYIVSCWEDEFEDAIMRGEFRSWTVAPQIVSQENAVSDNFVTEDVEEHIVYEKMDLSQIRELPSPNWHLATNSFLVHGFWNYGYLVLKKEMAEGQEKLSLGVPGIFEKQEAVMAVLFGFPEFKEIPSEMVEREKNTWKASTEQEKNQEPKTGTFGCWFVALQI